MWIKNFLISITKSLIVLLVATLIFSSVTLDFPNLMKGLFGDIFSYASPDAQKQTVNRLAETCSSLDKGQNVLTLNQICSNASLLESMQQNCNAYRELKRRNIQVKNEENVRETCRQLESGEIESSCQKNSAMPDLSSIGVACSDYKSGKIDDKEFFFDVIGSALPISSDATQAGFFDKYSKAMNYLNNNKTVYFLILLILTVILYLLITDIKLFILTLSQISFSIGIIIMLPYLAILAYEKFIGFDTTPILSSLFGAGNVFDFKALASVMLLLFLKTYSTLIITIGFIFLSIGIAGKIYWFMLRREAKTIEAKPKKKSKKEIKTEESKEKSTKHMLDELEKINKKKNRKG